MKRSCAASGALPASRSARTRTRCTRGARAGRDGRGPGASSPSAKLALATPPRKRRPALWPDDVFLAAGVHDLHERAGATREKLRVAVALAAEHQPGSILEGAELHVRASLRVDETELYPFGNADR